MLIVVSKTSSKTKAMNGVIFKTKDALITKITEKMSDVYLSCFVDIISTCFDQNENYKNRASYGECEKTPGYMPTNCMKSCDRCASYSDKHENCEHWASHGKCEKNADKHGFSTHFFAWEKPCLNDAISLSCDESWLSVLLSMITLSIFLVHCKTGCSINSYFVLHYFLKHIFLVLKYYHFLFW